LKLARWTLGIVGDLLVTAGLVLLLFVGWQLWFTDLTANRTQDATVSRLTRDFATPPPTTGTPGTESPKAVPFGSAFAIVRIPRFGADYARPVLEGTTRDILQDGIGHYDGTVLPGAVGNFAVAGHRTTYGRPFHDIDTLRTGDLIVVETKTAYSVYAVKRHEIVAPTDVQVVAAVPDKPGVKPTERWMTMTACHPKYSAAQRYVVFAQLVKTYPRADGLPAGTLTVPKSSSEKAA
jgi:sortase A